jgi:hypothetical protein
MKVAECRIIESRPPHDDTVLWPFCRQRKKANDLNGARAHPNSLPMISRLLRPLLAFLIAFALLGIPVAVNAAMPASCDCMHEISVTPQPCSDHSSMPCKGIAAACADAASCVAITGLPGQEISTAAWFALAPISYSIDNITSDGRSTQPVLDPPITI